MPDKEETLARHDYPAGVEKAPLAVGQHPGQEDLIGGKEGQGLQIAFPEKLLSVAVYSAPGVVMVENRDPVQGGVICYRRNSQINPGTPFTVNGPGRPAIDLLTEVLAGQVRQGKVMTDEDCVTSGPHPLRTAGIFRRRFVRL